jgi:hypothetical protein
MAFALSAAGTAAFYQSKKSRQHGRDEDAIQIFSAAFSGDLTRFCVYLRPFYVTKKIAADAGEGEKFELEDQIIGALRWSMPVIGLGKPGEALGVGRIFVDEEAWKSAVSELMKRAALIICVPSSHPGSLWELNHLIQNGYLTKTLFLMPPSEVSPKEIHKDWVQLVEHTKIIGLAFPDYPQSRFRWIGFKQKAGTLFSINPAGGSVTEKFFLSSKRSIRKAVARLRPKDANDLRPFSKQLKTMLGVKRAIKDHVLGVLLDDR